MNKTKSVLIAAVLALLPFLGGCSSASLHKTGSWFAANGATVTADAVTIAKLAYSTYTEVHGKKLDTSSVADLAYRDLSGIAILAQANIGLTPKAALIAQGATDAATAAKVVASLPNVPIDQHFVNNVWIASQTLLSQSTGKP